MRSLAAAAVAFAFMFITGSATAASLETLKKRDRQLTVSLYRHVGTVRFFNRHGWLLKYGPEQQRWAARKALKRAQIRVVVLRGERTKTRAALKKIHDRRVSGAFAIDSCTQRLLNMEGGMNPLKWNGGYVGVWEPGTTHGGSGAYGGPQALPGSKMASAGTDWATNIWTQIRWMIGYMNGRYGGSCAAVGHSYAFGWY